MVEVTKLDTIVEQHAVAQPVETVGENDFSLGSLRNTV